MRSSGRFIVIPYIVKTGVLKHQDQKVSIFLGKIGIIESDGGKMRLISILALLTLVLVGYQNCGNDVRTQGLFADELSSSSVEEGCDNSSCVNPEELLWLKIRESEPYRLNLSNINGHFTVGGVCGVGIYRRHSVKFQMVEAFGSQRSVAGGFQDDICDLGHFRLVVSPSTITVDQKYVLTLEIVGLGAGNQPESNPMPANVSSIEVIFESGS